MLRAAQDRPSAKVKMNVFYAVFFSLVFLCFLAGWFSGEGPYIAKSFTPDKCIVDNPTGNYEFDDRWHIARGKRNQRLNCIDMKDLNTSRTHITMDEVVYVFEIPETGSEALSNFVLNLNGYLMLDVVFRQQNISKVMKHSKVTYEIKLGFQSRNDTTDSWTTMAETTESRNLLCDLENSEETRSFKYGCNFIPFLTLGDDYNHRFLINIRFPNDFVGESTFNHDIQSINILQMVILHRTASFSRLLSILKFVTYPAAFVLVFWFFKSVNFQPIFVIEKSCLFLGFAHIVLNLPIDVFLAHRFYHFMLLVNYLRDIVFFAALTVFCASFFGQFIKARLEYKVMCFYFLYLSPLNLYSLVFLTDLFEKVVQIGNPFFGMWDSLAGFRYLPRFNLYSAIFAVIYLVIVSYQFHVFYRNAIIKQKITLHTRGGQLYSCGIKAFQFLMFGIYSITLLSTLEFMYFQLLEYNFKMEGVSAEILSLSETPILTGFLFAISAMWNLYTFAFLLLYAPNKDGYEEGDEERQDEMEMEVVQQEE